MIDFVFTCGPFRNAVGGADATAYRGRHIPNRRAVARPMEEFHPNEQMPAEFIRGELKKAGIYLGVLGMRYGSIDPATGLSMTELEYRQAVADRKKICVFLIAGDAPINVQMVERTGEGFSKLVELKDEIKATRTCGFFRTVDDLAIQARDALPRLHAQGPG